MESVLFFYLCIGSGDQTQVTRLMLQAPLSARPVYQPHKYTFVCLLRLNLLCSLDNGKLYGTAMTWLHFFVDVF